MHQFDDVKLGFDNNGDGDILDAGDDVLVDDNFNSSQISLSYDDNGNLTLDIAVAARRRRSRSDPATALPPQCQGLTAEGVYNYVYDAWNKLRKAQLVVGSDTTTIGEYEYYGDMRRSKKVVSNHGPEVVANDGGNTTVIFYYCGTGLQPVGRWSICETRNGSNQTTFQYLWGTQYTDELIWIEKTLDTAGAALRHRSRSDRRALPGTLCQERAGDSPLTRGGLRSRPDRAAIAGRGPQARVKGPTESNDTNPDDQSGESTADQRYFVHQDRQPLTHRVPLCGTDHEAIAGLCPERCVKGSWNVVALTGYANAEVVERYSYTPYGSFAILSGDSGSGELDSISLASTVGNVFAHQGLPLDQEKGSYANRHRDYSSAPQRFVQPDPAGYRDGASLYEYVGSNPLLHTDLSELPAVPRLPSQPPQDKPPKGGIPPACRRPYIECLNTCSAGWVQCSPLCDAVCNWLCRCRFDDDLDILICEYWCKRTCMRSLCNPLRRTCVRRCFWRLDECLRTGEWPE